MPKMVLSDSESGRAYNIELDEKQMENIVGRRIGDTIGGGALGLKGYRIKLTGGSDSDGFPMRKDLPGGRRPKILMRRGPGYRPREKGLIRRKRVRGNTYVKESVQVNALVEKKGSKSLDEIFSSGEE